MMKPKRDAQTSIRMPSDLMDELRVLAAADDRSLANYIVTVLQAHVAKKQAKK